MATEQRFSPGDDLALLVDGAVGGDERAWHALVGRLERVVWKAVNMMTPDAEIRDDAFAATWLRLAERLDTIREPQKLPGWLTTTATNEVRQIVRRRNRHLVGVLDAGAGPARSERTLDALPGDPGDHAAGIIDAEEASEVRSAFAVLDEHCRQVITVLVLTEPPLTYDEASTLLGRPIGSLGPTRQRCLEKMRKLLDLHQRPSGDRP
jgi:RNA polymerase sigma factor (sigma-70 family)